MALPFSFSVFSLFLFFLCKKFRGGRNRPSIYRQQDISSSNSHSILVVYVKKKNIIFEEKMNLDFDKKDIY